MRTTRSSARPGSVQFFSRVPCWHGAAIGCIATVGTALSCSTTDLDVVERIAADPEPAVSARAGSGPVSPASPGSALPSVPLGTGGAGPAAPPGPDLVPPGPTAIASSSPTEPADAGSPCTGIIPLNLYRLRSQATDTCLMPGPGRKIGGIDSFDTTLGDCNSDGAVWQIVASTLNSFEIRNVPTDYNLDVEMGVVELGTLLVLFPAHDLQNQKFVFDELTDGTIRILPRLGQAANLCVQATADRVALAQCMVGDSTAKWYIDAEDCAQ